MVREKEYMSFNSFTAQGTLLKPLYNKVFGISRLLASFYVYLSLLFNVYYSMGPSFKRSF